MTESATRLSERIYVRIPGVIVVNANGGVTSYRASTVNLSALGARVQTEIALRPGARVSFIWQGPKPQAFPSQVVWSAPNQEKQGHEAGLRFLQPLAVGAETT